METIRKRLATILSRNWWVLLVRGLAAVAFGILCWLRPGVSLGALVALFGAYALLDGLLLVWTAFGGWEPDENGWVLLLGGAVGIGVAVLTFAAPGVAARALLAYIAVWALGNGVLQLVAAIRLRKEISGEWLYILGGLSLVALGVLLVARPGEGALALLWVIGAWSIGFGVLLVVMSFKARGFSRRLASS
ncbi:MAG TPA: HdeD family acid-resistance protein [Longimicrobium sp.]